MTNLLPAPAADKFVTPLKRHLHRIRSDRERTLALFRGPGLPTLNLDARLPTTGDDRCSRAWARGRSRRLLCPMGSASLRERYRGRGSTELFDGCRAA